MVKETYVMVSKPLEIRKFEKYHAPMGWIRIDILKRKLREDRNYKAKFNQIELKELKEVIKE